MKPVMGLVLLTLMLTACQPRGLYDWGGYSQALNDYYGDPENLAEYRATLVTIIESGPDKRVPPGIYAELGYLELASGNTGEAKRLFEREKAAWPESAAFMDRMIRTIDTPESTEPSDKPAVDPAPTS